MSLRRDISRIIGYTIPQDKWQEAFDTVGKENRISQKQILQILVLLLEREAKRDETD